MRQFLSLILDLIFPKPPYVERLGSMSAEEWAASLPAARDLPDSMIAIFEYRHPLVRALVWEIKYWKNDDFARRAATPMYERIAEELGDISLLAGRSRAVIVPVPPSKHRLQKYGYSQCELLARHIAACDPYGKIGYVDALTRTREVPPQTSIQQRTRRLENMKGVFTARGHTFDRDTVVILIDDVVTTGSTLREATRALRESGARSIIPLALAH